MIVFTRTASIAPGKTGDALAFAHEIAVHVKKLTSVDVQIGMPVGGNPNRIAWTSTYDNLGGMDDLNAALMGDADYQAMVAKASDLFLPGSVRDSIWRTM